MKLYKQDFDVDGKILPEQEDYDEIERTHGRLPANATVQEIGERYRLVQAAKLIRQYAKGK